jgi:hypothetical protein
VASATIAAARWFTSVGIFVRFAMPTSVGGSPMPDYRPSISN